MEYIISPQDGRHPHQRIPLLCDIDFKYSFNVISFCDYPKYCGLEIGSYPLYTELDYILNQNSINIEALFPLVQRWLFFGILSEFAQESMRVSDFVERIGDQSYLTASKVSGLVEEYREYAKQDGEKGHLGHCRKLEHIFVQCREIMEILDTWWRDHEESFPTAGKINLSIICLGVTLEMTILQTHSTLPLRPFGNWSPAHFVRKRLIQDKWCPRLIFTIETELTPVEAYYASMLDTPKSSHSGCSEDECVAYNLNSATYVSRHRGDDCNCEFVQIDSAKVSKILQDGDIPILTISIDGFDKIAVEPIGSKRIRVYVAISHVWSDGLGNTAGNAIPRCQYVKIQSIATSVCEDLNGNIPFWLDTLAVPLERHERNIAIKRMAETYTRAHRVLVLVDELKLCRPNMEPLEFFMRLYCSPWMRRLWTLQEGVLAQELSVWVNEVGLSFDEMQHKFAEVLKSKPPMGVHLFEIFQNWRALGNPLWITRGGQENKTAKLPVLHKAMKFRKTSRLEDEAVCLASLLNVDMAPILNANTSADRMKELWSTLPGIPTGLIFTQGPRLQDKPFRWALASMLNTGGTLYDNGNRAHICTDGLNLQCPGWLLSLDSIPLRQHAFYFQERGRDEFYAIFSDLGDPKNHSKPSRLLEYAIILPERIETFLQKPQRTYVAIKVSVQRNNRYGALYGTFEERVHLYIVPRENWEERRLQSISDQHNKEHVSLRYCLATRLEPDQSWVVS